MITDLLLSGEGFGALIEAYDKQLLLAVNGSDSLFLDRVVRTLTNAFTWVPFYISMLWLVIRNNETMRKDQCAEIICTSTGRGLLYPPDEGEDRREALRE